MKAELAKQLANTKPIDKTSKQERAKERKLYAPSQLAKNFLSTQSRAARRSSWLVIRTLQGIHEQNGRTTDFFAFPFKALETTKLDTDTITATAERLEKKSIIEYAFFHKMTDPTGTKPFIWHPIGTSNPYDISGVSPQLKIVSPKAFQILFSKLRAEFQQKPHISYNPKTGTGYANDKRFAFRNDQDAFKVFSLMYNHMGEPVASDAIEEALQHTGTGLSLRVNEMAKHMRKLTGLNTDHIVLNNRSLTLIGEAPKNSAPKSP